MGLKIKNFNCYNFFLPESLLLRWEIADTTEDLSKYMYIIYKGEFYGDNIFSSSPNNIGKNCKSPFEERLDDLQEIAYINNGYVNEFLDKEINPYKLDHGIYYRITPVNKITKEESESFPLIYIFNNEMERDMLGGKNITSYVRSVQNIYLKVIGNKIGYILKKIRSGEKCHTCWDDIMKENTYPDCPECFGTGYSRGYYRPYTIQFNYLTPVQNTSENLALEGIDVAKSNITIWTTSYPYIEVGDIFVSAKNERYVVKSVHHTTRNNEYILRQDLTLSKLPMSDVAYQFVFTPEEAIDYYGYKESKK